MTNSTPINPDPNMWEEPTPTDWTTITTALVGFGLADEDAVEWEQSGLPVKQHLVDRATSADREGLSPATYANWCLLGAWGADEALAHIDAGYTRAQAHFVRYLLFLGGLFAPAGTRLDKAPTWLASALSPEWVCRLLANGITTVADGLNVFWSSFDDPELVGRLDLNAVLRGADNRELLIDHDVLIAHLVEPAPR